MKNTFKIFSQSSFVRNVATVASGTAIAQAITLVFSPIITRLYGAEAFGLLGIFTSITSLLIPIAALTYPMAIVIPKEDSKAISLGKLSVLLGLLISSLTALVIFLLNSEIILWFNLEKIGNLLYFVPSIMFAAVLAQVLQQWLIRKKKFNLTAKAAVFQNIFTNGAKTSGGFLFPFPATLITITAIGNLFQPLLLYLGVKKRRKFKLKDLKLTKSSFILLKRFSDFPSYRAPQIFINTLAQSIPILMLTSLFGAVAAGLYVLARSVLTVPVTLIGKSVGDVFYPRISEAFNNNENMSVHIKKATISLALAGFIPFSIIVIFGPWIFQFVFGDEWLVAGKFAQWMSLWLYGSMLNRPSVAAIPVLKLQKFFLFYEVISLVIITSAMGLGYFVFRNEVFTMMSFSLAGLTLDLVLIWTVYRTAGNKS